MEETRLHGWWKQKWRRSFVCLLPVLLLLLPVSAKPVLLAVCSDVV